MFERRLKIFLIILLVLTGVLVLRAMQLQVFSHAAWAKEAQKAMRRATLVETTRGAILDNKGRPIAVDEACIDACVYYPFISPDPDEEELKKYARKRLVGNLEYKNGDRPTRERVLAEEVKRVRLDLQIMWETLAKLSGKKQEEITDTRLAIVNRVETRRRYLWYMTFQKAMEEHEKRSPGWIERFLLGEDAPELDNLKIEVSEQLEAHAILKNISQEVANRLAKDLERYPGLVLRPGKARVYPFEEAGCHLIGYLTKVNAEEYRERNVGKDELRRYWPNDYIGRDGIERLAEDDLRGTRGRVQRLITDGRIDDAAEAIPGKDVQITIDIALQKDLQAAFRNARVRYSRDRTEQHPMHGAAVVIDLRGQTNDVRALVSYPDFDLNELQDNYAKLVRDEIEKPMLNRATRMQLVPGSTVKPIVGLGAITQGLIGAEEGIECTGYLTLNGRVYRSFARCWTASMYAHSHGDAVVRHHGIPYPHQPKYPGQLPGHLSFADAIERSCNVYFETLGDKLGLEGLAYWYSRFGLGKRTGIGIPELPGRIPSATSAGRTRASSWFSAIGQDQVEATPIQMATVAATIARDGIWMRPRLFPLKPGEKIAPEDRVDLKLSKRALEEAKAGMIAVVQSRAGTGTMLRRSDMTVAGKTGSAQAPKFSIVLKDENGKEIRDENGRVVRHYFEPHNLKNPNPKMKWYLGTGDEGTDLSHAWYIGYAPADEPQIAFAVLVEYGGSGGNTAAAIAQDIIERCVEHGYLMPDRLRKGKGVTSAQ